MEHRNATRKPRPFKLRGVFFGTSEFAVPALRAFAGAVDCRLVVTQPDRPAGRGQKLVATPVKRAARELGIATIEPESLRTTPAELSASSADLFAVASYGKIVPQPILDLPASGALNVHPSLLPLYRGASPLQSQLRDGVTESGVTVILMDAGMDTGDIVLVERCAIAPGDTYGTLHDRLAEAGAHLLARACAQAAAGTLVRVAQRDMASAEAIAATLTRPIRKADLTIDWSWPGKRIVNHVRAFAPQPAARGWLDGESEMVKILELHSVARPRSGELSVACGAGEYVVIDRLIPANRKAVSGSAYAAARHSCAERAGARA